MRLSLRLIAPLLLASVLGCETYGRPGSSLVAQGRYFSTGNADYDEFFVRLFRLQVDLEKSPAALQRTRGALAATLGAPADADTPVLRRALAERSAKLQAAGVRLSLQQPTPDARATLDVAGTPSGADAELVGALEALLVTLGDIRERLPGWQRELDVLPARGIALESSLDAAFVGKGPAKKATIRDNLADAAKVIALMGPRLKELTAASTDLGAALAGTFGAPPPEPPPPVEEKKRPTKPVPPSRPSGAPPHPTPTKPAPKPVAANADAAEPAPTPKPQGTAKPDFEP